MLLGSPRNRNEGSLPHGSPLMRAAFLGLKLERAGPHRERKVVSLMSVCGQTKKSEGAAPKRQAKGIKKTPSTWPGLPVSKTGNPCTRDLGKVPYTRLEALLQPRCPFQVRGRKAVFNGNLETGARLGFNVQMSAPMQQP